MVSLFGWRSLLRPGLRKSCASRAAAVKTDRGHRRRRRPSSVARNSSLIIRNTIAQIEQRLGDEHPLAAAEVSRFRAAIMRCQSKLKGAQEDEATALAADLHRLDERLVTALSTEQGPVVAGDEALALIAKYVTNREQAGKLSEAINKIRG
jgi:hypothetical protein